MPGYLVRGGQGISSWDVSLAVPGSAGREGGGQLAAVAAAKREAAMQLLIRRISAYPARSLPVVAVD
ncbi:hypothetical protein C3B78_04780 [Arthrobacter sp. PGP41]|nr:hypothetical protein C3B78_04780 [Arthrobacter sp. PGP41]